MYKSLKSILLFCLIFLGGVCCAHDVVNLEEGKEGDEHSIGVIAKSSVSGLDRSSAIIPIINGHILTIVFGDNLGQVSVEITTVTGDLVNCSSVLTPNGLQYYIPNAGSYIVTFTLSNGDEYYGEFIVDN